MRMRGAFIQHMDYDKVDRFRDVVRDLNYLTRCQIISTIEPYEVNMFHPKYELLNVCSFLLVPRHGLPSVEGIWPPKVIARELNRENGVESDENDDSGADSDDFIGDEEDGDDGWNFQEDSDCYLRSFSPATKVFRVVDENFQIERVENERLVFLTNDDMSQKRKEIETYLADRKHSLKQLPEKWMVYGTSCAVLHEGILKRAAIYRINDYSLNLLLVDYGINIEIAKSEVFSLPNEEPVNSEPQLTLVSLAAFDFIHYSRVEVIRQLLPTGTLVHFERERRSKDIPTKGDLFLRDGTPVEQIVNETISDRNLYLECLDIVPFCGYTEYNMDLHHDQINLDFLYTRESSVIYKKSKLVASKF
ncbi:hypothetical protein B9Z55_013844 [Caenorhabditis nigoni]|uniref:Tudor domain-containing protein n=2 Tax=Caenorhabditis nigoni TaxID=1611254 RepID=A0A2G5U3H7_9PELO|nr:hypothetical protein B9Z55_013844 [Caenorhabditis nigoni]